MDRSRLLMPLGLHPQDYLPENATYITHYRQIYPFPVDLSPKTISGG
jgi:hypothetical protein